MGALSCRHLRGRGSIHWAFIVLLAVALPSCVSRPGPEMLTPVAAPPGVKALQIYVATTRERENPSENVFTANRAKALNFAKFAVSIPPNHKPGNVELPADPPDSQTSFAIVNQTVLSDADFRNAVAPRAGRKKHRVFVFVHGFNNNFQESVFRLAQLQADAKIDGIPVLFSWPSQAQVIAYEADREAALASRDQLMGLLTMLTSSPAVGDVLVVAHSMGAMLTIEALRQLRIEGKNQVIARLGRVVLAVWTSTTRLSRRRRSRPRFRSSIFRASRRMTACVMISSSVLPCFIRACSTTRRLTETRRVHSSSTRTAQRWSNRSTLERKCLLSERVGRVSPLRYSPYGLPPDGSSAVQIQRRQKFLPRRGLPPENAQHAARHHGDARLVDAPGGHAVMHRFDHHRDAQWFEDFVQARSDLGGHFLLDLQALGIHIDEPRQLGNSDHAPPWHIGDVRLADDRREVMLAMRLERDIPQRNDFVVARDLFKCPAQVVGGVLLIAGEPFLERTRDPRGRALKPFAVRVVAGPAEQHAHGIFSFRSRRLLGFGSDFPDRPGR